MDQEETAHLQRIFLFLQEEITNIVQADVNFQLVMEMGTGIHIVIAPVGIIQTVCHHELPS